MPDQCGQKAFYGLAIFEQVKYIRHIRHKPLFSANGHILLVILLHNFVKIKLYTEINKSL
jgi:hypothetical protein